LIYLNMISLINGDAWFRQKIYEAGLQVEVHITR